MKRSTLVLILFLIALCIIIAFLIPRTSQITQQPTTTQQAASDSFCLEGCPTGASKDNIIVTHHVLKLSNNSTTKLADWVAYKISTDTMGSGCKRTWEADPDLPDGTTLRPKDYTGIKAALDSDRGHQAPLASLCGSQYWYEADYLSNITPQKSDLNEGTWEHLEQAERNLVKDGNAIIVYSITGPLYERKMPVLPRSEEDMTVPSGYWKIISIEKEGKIEETAFAMDQGTGRDEPYCSKKVSLEEVERRSHLKFFPDAIANSVIESSWFLSALGC